MTAEVRVYRRTENLGVQFRQNIFIAIKVSGFSAGSCQPKDYVAYVHVNLQIVRGNCIRRRVNVLNGLPGFVGQPPGW